MRYVALPCLREGMFLAKSIYTANNELLLAKGQKLISKYIYKLQAWGFPGVYIDDDLSKDIEIVNVIKDELRYKTINTVKNVFIYSKTGDQENFEKSFDESKKQVSSMVNEILDNSKLMLNMVDLKIVNDYTYYHSVNVAVVAIALGMAMGYNYHKLYWLGLGALMHDVGKVFVPEKILNKNSSLTDEEFLEIRKHPKTGYDYLKKNCIMPETTFLSVLQHHERFNGSGYPYGLSGDEITIDSRIIAVSDVYDAMISDRPYRKGLPHSEVIDYIVGQSAMLFDPDIVRVFYKKIAPYPVGSVVCLSNGERGIVLENFESDQKRPKIRIIDDSKHYRDVYMGNKDYENIPIISCDY